jgi:catechol-2,3-dioxygenase
MIDVLNAIARREHSKEESRMIGVKKIAHATYETPDLDQQIEYYTDILGLGLIARE